ncbi:MAG TPA: hypothetical protein VHI31_08955, partial [Actinomycetota bacterium]|nr:hypothetical protein [Actinomycetota bacterium]
MRRLAAYVALSAILCLLLTHLWRTPASAQAACDLLTASKSGEATFRIATVAPVPCIFVSDGSVVEGNSEAAVEFRVYTTLPRDFSYFVDYSTAGLTATPGVDFVAVSGTVALSVSTPSVVISVPVIGDLAFEPDEILQLNLTAAGEGFRIEDGQGIGTIVNDDPAPPPAPAPAPAPAPEAVPVPEPQPAPEPPAPPVFTVPTPAAPAPGAPPAPAPSLMPAPNPPAATGPGQTVSVRAFGGGTQSPPGGAIALSARGFASCAEVLFFLDGVRIASAVPAPEGDASIDPVSVPGDAEPGRHTVLARCDGPGFGAPRARLTVTSPPVHRTALVTSLPQPWEVPVDAVSIGISLLAALGMIVLVAVPAELFNSTLEEHNAEIRARLRLPPQRAQPRQPLSPVATFTLFVFVGGFLYALLSPGFGPDASSFALVAGMTIALAV